jgi:pimeloyl-ACP methyl ester carboxylesterase
MKKIIIASALLISIHLTFAFNFQDKDVEGVWQGKLEISGMELRIVFKISRAEDGSLSATMDSPDQGAKDMPVDDVIVKQDSLIIDMKSIGGRYEGKIDNEIKQIDGTWRQSGYVLPLVLEHSEKKPEVKRPQEPKKPYPYEEEDVSYENTDTGIKLAGTLTCPRSEGTFPAVILITGSGPQDRDETVFGHRPFLVLADYLTRRGIAVLRTDDRGVGGSSGNISTSTSEDFAGDVLVGIEYLKHRSEVDAKHIGLVGHSEGGIIAPMAAVRSSDVAFIVLMAGTGLTGEDILYMQGDLINKAMGRNDEALARNRTMQEGMFRIMKEEMDSTALDEKLRAFITQSLETWSEEERKELTDEKMFIDSQVRRVNSPWFRFFLTYDPRPALRKVRCPVLAVIGEKDLQVPPKENLKAIKQALKEGGNKDFTIKELPGLNHMFQAAETGSPIEYARIEETISPTVLDLMGDWILEKTGKQ